MVAFSGPARAGLAVEMRGVTKRFPGVLANDRIDLGIAAGEIHAVVGENGAGKSTLMGILSGVLRADEGEVFLHGHPVHGHPEQVSRRGLGMVYQHFMLVPTFTVTENVILGVEPRGRFGMDLRKAEEAVRRLSSEFGLRIEPSSRVQDLSVGEQQRVEILKVLHRGSNVIVLDEPTQVLTPGEKVDLFETLRRLVRDGRTIVFITHHLDEVLALSDRVTVLRRGRVVASLPTRETDAPSLARLMVGRDLGAPEERTGCPSSEVLLDVNGLNALSKRGLHALNDVSFALRSGEILGVAGVEGNGQKELVETLTGLRTPAGGSVRLSGRQTRGWSRREFLEGGLGVIPADRRAQGLVEAFSVAENLVLGRHRERPFSRWGFMDLRAVRDEAARLVTAYGVQPPETDVPVGTLSGGNQQRVLVAREIARRPRVLVAAHPTRGLDIAGRRFVHGALLRERAEGAGVLLVSSDLDEILDLSDRIAVLFEGRVVGILPRDEADEETLGLLMLGGTRSR